MINPSHAPSSSVVIATHNGSFHADDIFGVAVLMLLHPQAQLIRTRDTAQIAQSDFAVDVGGEWDATRGRFDHHQRGFAGARDGGVVYASAGLVWREYGAALVEKMFGLGDAPLAQSVAAALDEELVQHLDRADTGAAHGAPGLFGLSALMSQFNTTWDIRGDAEQDEVKALAQFRKAVEVMTTLLTATLDQLRAKAQGAALARNAEKLFGGQVLLMPRGGLPWREVISREMPEVLFVVYPDSSAQQYQLHVVTVEPHSFQARKDLPKAWAGLRLAELAEVTGVADAVFCHNGRFIAGAASLAGATRLAEIALAADA
ncbi:MYG1 family protein [Variovorax sp. HJSM1_2]|uniref:MYG1 family protein n=1 Tax=Variovorax sp. HJSM1_2 TaxID=3366263 RepID=UPI003BE75386